MIREYDDEWMNEWIYDSAYIWVRIVTSSKGDLFYDLLLINKTSNDIKYSEQNKIVRACSVVDIISDWCAYHAGRLGFESRFLSYWAGFLKCRSKIPIRGGICWCIKLWLPKGIILSKIVITIGYHGPMVGSRACKVGVLGSNPQMDSSTNHLFNPFLGWVENTLNVCLKLEFVRRRQRIGRASAGDCMRYIVPPWSNPCLSFQFQIRRQKKIVTIWPLTRCLDTQSCSLMHLSVRWARWLGGDCKINKLAHLSVKAESSRGRRRLSCS